MQEKIKELQSLLESMQAQMDRARILLQEMGVGDFQRDPAQEHMQPLPGFTPPPIVRPIPVSPIQDEENAENMIAGVFDGQHMTGQDGKVYTIPANYASKSKLVEGDGLKLTIAEDGTFIYKQIRPIDRRRVTGVLAKDDNGSSYSMVTDSGRNYKLLTASITYFKGEPGDTVVGMIPGSGHSQWAAVEHVIPAGQGGSDALAGEEEHQADMSVFVPLHEGDEGLLPSGEEGMLPEPEAPTEVKQ